MSGNRGLQRGWRRSWGASFDAVSTAYDTARPGYPRELYRDLVSICDLGENTRVLEVGCGTGQATVDLAPYTKHVLALEPGVALAEKARQRLEDFQNVDVLTSTFEEFVGEAGAFDIIVSATAFHWVKPEIGFVEAAELLRPGGWLALWWTAYEDPEEEDPFGEEVSRLLDSRGFPGYSGPGYSLRADDRISDFAKSSKFGPVEIRQYRWKGHHSTNEARMLFSTYSNIQAMEEPERLRMLDGIEEIAVTKFGGRVRRPYVTSLYAARKIRTHK